MKDKSYREKAVELDRNDPLAGYREAFIHPDEPLIYLDGNSLGKLPKKTAEITGRLISEQWGKRLIRGWNEEWLDLPRRVAGKIARIVGAEADEIFVGDSTSVNLYKLAFGALSHLKERKTIVTDSLNFPSDIYILRGIIDSHFPRHKLETAPGTEGTTTESAALAKIIGSETALVTLSHVTFKSSFKYDMPQINSLAKKAGSLMLWDLSHSAGAAALSLNDSEADMAVGCTYKYLNGGPGAPAFSYIRGDLQERIQNPVRGWFGHEAPFDFDPSYKPARDISQQAVGSPHILSMAAVEPSLDLILEAGMDRISSKSRMQTTFIIESFDTHLKPLGFSLGTPRNPDARGSHVTIRHPESYRINQALIHPAGDVPAVIGDFRPPDNIRLGIAPLYTKFADLAETIFRIREIVNTGEYERFSKTSNGVP